MKSLLRSLVNIRIFILAIIGAGVYAAITYYNFSLLYIILAGTILGIVFGKVFCRWACPVGLLMEIIMRTFSSDKTRQMYQYHKMGCPIAWITGFLNRLSIFRISNDKSLCTDCGACDRKCYMVAVEPQRFSLYKNSKEKPDLNYSCSKCLECVVACPTGSLKFKAYK